MTSLAHFSASEAELLISLPYRAGLLVSHADDEDGEIDDRREMAALAACLKAAADLRKDSPFTAEVMKETLRLRFEWPRWAEKALNVYDDSALAVSLLKSKAGESTARAYGAGVMEVATAVARAYGEFSTFGEEEEENGVLGALFSKILEGFASLSPDDEGHPMNVSASEGGVLSRLSAALKI